MNNKAPLHTTDTEIELYFSMLSAQQQAKNKRLRIYHWIIVAIAIGMIIGMFYMLAQLSNSDEGFPIIGMLVGILGALIPALLSFWTTHKQKILLNAWGIQLNEGFNFGWSLSWSSIRKASIRVPPSAKKHDLLNSLYFGLELHTSTGKKRLNPCVWFEKDKLPDDALMQRIRKVPTTELETVLQAFPIIQHLHKHNVRLEIDYIDADSVVGFDISANWVAATVVITMLFAMFYALMELVIAMETYMETPPYKIFWLTASAAAALAFIAQVRNKVPQLIAGILSIFLAAGVWAASYPGVLRINQFTDNEGLRTYNYTIQDDLSLQPPAQYPDLPAFTWHWDDDEYWRGFPVGAEYPLEVRKGGLDFYQINLAPIYIEIQNFYVNDRADPSS